MIRLPSLSDKDPLLKHLVEKYHGFRVIGIPDLFEAITWAIMGQQITLSFAYALKKRFVQSFGEQLEYDDYTYWLSPKPEIFQNLETADLTNLQFTKRKAEFIIGVAKLIVNGELTKETAERKIR